MDEHYTARFADEDLDEEEAWRRHGPGMGLKRSLHGGGGLRDPSGPEPTRVVRQCTQEPSIGFREPPRWLKRADGPTRSGRRTEHALQGDGHGRTGLQLCRPPLCLHSCERAFEEPFGGRFAKMRPSGFKFLPYSRCHADFVSLWAKSADMEVNSPTWLKANATDELFVE